ncbi:MAG: vitamin B12-dependent ribonucleotide reductase [Candidatus Gracilibacteria bacterium]|jgi:ribonucleoside-diphosphate reductase alpha chain
MAQIITPPVVVTEPRKIARPRQVDQVPASESNVTNTVSTGRGLSIKRRFTKPEVDAYDMVEYETRESKITEPSGKIVFEMSNVEVPKSWSQLATDIIAQKYFRRKGVPVTGGENSIKQTVSRIAHTIRIFGEAKDYFATTEDAENFEQELVYMLLTQRGAFNSPVWFNCGIYQAYGVIGDRENYAWDFQKGCITEIENNYERPQCSACFIQKVEDSLMGIFELAKNEAKLFKYGSGTGSNFSQLRSKYESLSGGGISSGLMSFLEVLDKGAGAIKSGGITRRAAKMVVLDIDHPEIRDFVNWKVESEKKAKALIDAGYDSDWRGEAYRTVSGQNSNNSVRVTDEFMTAVEKGEKFWTRRRGTGEKFEEFDANELFDEICHAAWSCADPGLQFDDTINDWHTCPNSGRINSSNPCSEYMFVDDSACNLASLNLLKFLDEDGTFDIPALRHAARIFLLAQDIIIDLSSYPTPKVAENSHNFRPLGIGYTNLGTALMMMGIPYDSDSGRTVAAALTAIMHCHSYVFSAEMAKTMGAFTEYDKNRELMLRVMRKHQSAAHQINHIMCPVELYHAACEDADEAVRLGEKYGFRNAQVTVLAPTGTIGLLMDCDTTGIEPEFSIVKWKKLSGGGYFKIINKSIMLALKRLGYTDEQITEMTTYVLGHGSIDGAPFINPTALKELGFADEEIAAAKKHVEKAKTLDEWTAHISTQNLELKGLKKEQIAAAKLYIEGTQTMEGAPHLKEEHFAIFDCANRCGIGTRYIAPIGHIKMMAAVQPFLSGAISKTVNLPHEATVKDIRDIYFDSWKRGIKAIALYRDGSKHSQPLSNKSDSKKADAGALAALPPEKLRGAKLDLPLKRRGITVESSVAGQKMYLRTGEYEDGKLGEIFIDTFKEGASYRSLLNCFAVAISIGLQYGVPLEKYVDSFTFTRFDPSGFTTHPNIRTCTSIVDFIFRILGMEYLGRTDFVHVEPKTTQLAENTGKKKISEAITKEAELTEEIANVSEQTTKENSGMDKELSKMMGDAPLCTTCGHVTVRNATCYKCLNCGNSLGCS